MRNVRQQLASGATITATGYTAGTPFNNPQTESEVQGGVVISVLATATGAVTGTTPTLNFVIEVSVNGTDWYTVATMTNLTTSGNSQRLTASGIVEPFIRVSQNVGGTTPSFGGVNVDVILG